MDSKHLSSSVTLQVEHLNQSLYTQFITIPIPSQVYDVVHIHREKGILYKTWTTEDIIIIQWETKQTIQ